MKSIFDSLSKDLNKCPSLNNNPLVDKTIKYYTSCSTFPSDKLADENKESYLCVGALDAAYQLCSAMETQKNANILLPKTNDQFYKEINDTSTLPPSTTCKVLKDFKRANYVVTDKNMTELHRVFSEKKFCETLCMGLFEQTNPLCSIMYYVQLKLNDLEKLKNTPGPIQMLNASVTASKIQPQNQPTLKQEPIKNNSENNQLKIDNNLMIPHGESDNVKKVIVAVPNVTISTKNNPAAVQTQSTSKEQDSKHSKLMEIISNPSKITAPAKETLDVQLSSKTSTSVTAKSSTPTNKKIETNKKAETDKTVATSPIDKNEKSPDPVNQMKGLNDGNIATSPKDNQSKNDKSPNPINQMKGLNDGNVATSPRDNESKNEKSPNPINQNNGLNDLLTHFDEKASEEFMETPTDDDDHEYPNNLDNKDIGNV